GWGYVDASRLPQYLPAPRKVEFNVANMTVLGTGVAIPGSLTSLQLTVTNSAATIDRVTGRISAVSSLTAAMVQDQADFVFGQGGTTAMSSQPYTLQLSSSLTNGTSVPLQITFTSSTGIVLDSLIFNLSVGYPAPGSVAATSTGRLNLTISDFGQYGFAAGSIYNLGTPGCTFDNSGNLLYEAGLLIGRNSLQMASAIRDSIGQFHPSDYRPQSTTSLSTVVTYPDGSLHHFASMTDAAATIQIPITVHQESIDYSATGYDGFKILSYYLVNHTLEKQTGIRFGFLADFDLSSGADVVGYSASENLVYQHSNSGPWIGFVALSGTVHFTSMTNGESKRGIGGAERFALLSTTSNGIDSGVVGDQMLFVNSDAMTLAVGDSSHIAIALVAGNSFAELAAAAQSAREKYDVPTVVDDRPLLPEEYNLAQNYPNPFNPSTTISFSLDRAADVSLVVFNTLGQAVMTLVDGAMPAGTHSLEWSGQTTSGTQAATGVYFYRLTANGSSQSKKMMLLK
ncbi:MAG: FlgD immunoglobulin-like domain containing protein, partial [Candidatus Zixiibacteriota bacterium]